MILYEDKDIIVCHKMAGIAVQSARIGGKDLVSMLNNHLMEQAGQRMEPVRVVHRLDQPVEGIVVFLSRFISIPDDIIRSGCRWRMQDFHSLVIENIIRNGNYMQRCGRRRW